MTLAVILVDEDATDEAVAEFVDKLKPGIREILQHGTKSSSGELADSLAIHVENRRVIRIESSAKHAGSVDRGVMPHAMWYLINKVVPLKLPGGTTVFRRVSLESIIKGKWRHPGTTGLNFVERGAELARARMELPLRFRMQKPPPVVTML